ncbi:MAG TPA: hypothetical protein VK452_02120 [Dissulfurispiraceae bacterium]|nr:hypothetical protein [Dissulfurispiraceae bacterium]
MAEPLTIAGAGLAILGSKDILNKLLGPTVEYLGEKTEGLVKKCDINLDRLFLKAYKKLGARAEQPGAVNPRVLKQVVDEGRFIEDDLVAEYYGGVLAGSKSAMGDDDRGIYYLSLIKGLSAFQLRLHYSTYLKMCTVYNKRDDKAFEKLYHRQSTQIRIPKPFLSDIFGSHHESQFDSIVLHAITGLREKLLIGKEAVLVDGLKHPKFRDLKGQGIIVSPTILGCDLFIWGNGFSHLSGTDINKLDIDKIKPLYDVSSINIELPSPGTESDIQA